MGLDLKILIKKYPNSEHCRDILSFERDEELFSKIKELENENGNLAREYVKFFDAEGNELQVLEDAYGKTIKSVEAFKLFLVMNKFRSENNIDIYHYLHAQPKKCEVYLYWH